jgi:protein involved in polysaccharide export with SLBB domain
MKKLISASILPLCLVSFVVAGNSQTRQVQKPKTVAQEEKNNRPSVSGESVAKNNDSATSPSSAPSLTEIYLVGIGDVLDIRFMNSPNSGRSTLFTVVAGGIIDLPLAGGSVTVAGLTTEEIQNRIRTELKRRAFEQNAEVSVGVRQYNSHTVLVTGLVASPGDRVLRREAVPLYVILAESQLRNDAASVLIMRGGSAMQSLNLSDPISLNTAVTSGDVITVVGRTPEFYYIGGRINYPGQKNFQSGITLLQAILAAGGTVRQNDNSVDLSREGADGRLTTTRFNLKEIKAGNVSDPKLQPGDRIEVLR